MNLFTQTAAFMDAAHLVDCAADSLPREAWRSVEVEALRDDLSSIRAKLSALASAAFTAADEMVAERHARAAVVASLQDLIEDAGRHAGGESVLPALQECLERLK